MTKTVNVRVILSRFLVADSETVIMNKRVLTAVLLAGACVAPIAFSQFGIPSVVFDPAADAHWIQELAQALRTYQQAVLTYRTTVYMWDQIQANARFFTGKESWRYLLMPGMYPSSATDLYGTTGGWLDTLNTGLAATRNYELATVRAASPYGMFGLLSPAVQGRFGMHYASMEINDAAAQHAMSVSGTVRANLEQQNAAISALQDASLSDGDEDNSEVTVLNKVNSAAMISAQTAQGTNQILAAMSDQQTVELKMRHDMLADEINASVAAQAAQAANTDALWGGHAASLTTRIP